VNRGVIPTSQTTAINNTFEDAYYPANPGNLGNNNRLQNNQHEGFYIDNFTVGLAGRGEMVTGAQSDPTMTAAPQRQPWMPGFPPPSQVPSGPYQLEIRRGADYATSNSTITNDITLQRQFDLRQQVIPDLRTTTPANPVI